VVPSLEVKNSSSGSKKAHRKKDRLPSKAIEY